VHAALVDIAEAVISELGITDLLIREPGLERLEDRALTYLEATERLGGLMAHLPDGLHDGAIVSAQGAAELLRPTGRCGAASRALTAWSFRPGWRRQPSWSAAP